MLNIVAELIPLLVIFLIGYSLKHIGLLKSADGNALFRLLFYIGLPALIFTTLREIDLSMGIGWLALLPLFVIILTLAAVYLLRSNVFNRLDYKTFGALIAGVIIMNTGFLIPFIEQFYGEAGLARLMIVDTFNGILTFSLVYAVMVKLSSGETDKSYILKKLAASPPLWALILAIVFNATNASVPAAADQALSFIAGLVGPIILLALGLKFQLYSSQPKLIAPALALRFILGGLIGLGFVQIFNLQGLDAHIAILASMAPIGFNSIVFAELEKFNTDYAAAQVSIGLLTAIVLLPFAVYGLHVMYPI